MNWLIVASVLLLLILGSLIALAWWRLAARMAPYKDELGKPGRRSPDAARDRSTVVVIPRGGGGGQRSDS